MRYLIILFFILPKVLLSQNDYKNFDKAVNLNLKGKTEKAIKYAKKAIENSNDWKQPYLLLASIYSNKKQIEIAAQYLLKVYDYQNPKHSHGIEKIIDLYYKNGFYENALFYAKKIKRYSNRDEKIYLISEKYIKNCEYAINAIKNPVDFQPFNLGQNINSNFAEFVNCLSFDGTKFFFTRRIEDKNNTQEDLYFFDFKDSIVSPLPFNTNFNEGAISISPDGRLCVYTACDRSNSFGGCDLYFRRLDKYNRWSIEYNLGNKVNSSSWDTQPRFSPDGKYLYFISNRNGGIGGDDIWRSEIKNGKFFEPQNLGPTINTMSDEMSPFLHADNLTFYFASKGHIGMGSYDIFVSRRSNTSTKWLKPKNIGYPINTYQNENSLIVANNGKTAFFSSSNFGFGLEDIFVFNLPDNLQSDSISQLEVDIITNNDNEEIIMQNVTFSTNSFLIDSASFLELDQLIVYLKKNPNLIIEIQGHTDNVGDSKYNYKLSTNRAKSVFKYLSRYVKNKINYVGYGESVPIMPNNTKEGRRMNRRTSFIIQ